MERKDLLAGLQKTEKWDVIVIGGGATGLGTALESVSRGYKTLLLEQADFAKGTSSRSTKLVHGGVRYLQQGDVALVLEALQERGLLIQNAPHLVRNQAFIIPNYDWWQQPFYSIGLKVYDLLAGRLGLSPSKRLSKEKLLKAIPTLIEEGLRGGVKYFDGQFDDSRLAVNLAQTIADLDGFPINYMKVTSLIKEEEMVKGVQATDVETGTTFSIKGKIVINATGVFVDSILKMDKPDAKDTIRPSQGIHLVLDREFLPGKSALMVPQTEDGRVLFAVPWKNKVIVGTTDTQMDKPSLEPRALEEEISFILRTAGQYLKMPPTRKDVRSVYAGLRPLAAPAEGEKSTKEISRSHKIVVSDSGMLTILGGKWTTYRKMGEDAIEKAAFLAGLEDQPCITKRLMIHGFSKNVDRDDPLHMYGSDAKFIRKMVEENPELGEQLHPSLPFIKAEIVWSARKEMARTVEDILSRRQRALLLDAKVSIEMAPKVARLLAKELHRDEAWEAQQVKEYTQLAQEYMLPENR